MITRTVSETFLSGLLNVCAAQLLDGAAGGGLPPRAALSACLRDCFASGQGTDDLRAVHAMVLRRVLAAYAPDDPADQADLLLFPAMILAAEGFQLAHRGSFHAHAVCAVLASCCKLPYADALGGRPRADKITLKEELYHGAEALLLGALDLDGLSFFAASPAPDCARARLLEKLGASAPEDRAVLGALCAGACLLASFHQEGKNGQPPAGFR